MVNIPSELVAAPFDVPSIITLAPASACPSVELTVPLILPVVCVHANDTSTKRATIFEIFLIFLPPYCN